MAVLLSKFEGMSYAEIAAVMEIVAPGDQVAALAGAGEPPRSAATLLRSRRPSRRWRSTTTMNDDPSNDRDAAGRATRGLPRRRAGRRRAAAASRNCWPPTRKSVAVCKRWSGRGTCWTTWTRRRWASQFTQTTLEMVAVAARKDVGAEPGRGPAAPAAPAAGDRRRPAGGRRGRLPRRRPAVPDPNRQLLEDLPVLENLDEYRPGRRHRVSSDAPRRRAVFQGGRRNAGRRGGDSRTNRWPSGGSASRA